MLVKQSAAETFYGRLTRPFGLRYNLSRSGLVNPLSCSFPCSFYLLILSCSFSLLILAFKSSNFYSDHSHPHAHFSPALFS